MNAAELSFHLLQNHKAFEDYIGSLDEKLLVSAPEGKWTPAQHFDHIRRSTGAVTQAMRLPKFVFRFMFGLANRPSRTFDALVEKYQTKLKDGGKAGGRFVPEKISSRQLAMINKEYEKAITGLVNKLKNWNENDLDRYILPHPLLGKLTIREMMYFTIYHVVHHHHLCLKQSVDSTR
ncbi:DinB family protein [Pollutibacter soli]|uniref:DinB family protein n=1 Tax=Pollutibacter soli TaxID=3034157 RepID=UPI00301386DE